MLIVHLKIKKNCLFSRVFIYLELNLFQLDKMHSIKSVVNWRVQLIFPFDQSTVQKGVNHHAIRFDEPILKVIAFNPEPEFEGNYFNSFGPFWKESWKISWKKESVGGGRLGKTKIDILKGKAVILIERRATKCFDAVRWRKVSFDIFIFVDLFEYGCDFDEDILKMKF